MCRGKPLAALGAGNILGMRIRQIHGIVVSSLVRLVIDGKMGCLELTIFGDIPQCPWDCCDVLRYSEKMRLGDVAEMYSQSLRGLVAFNLMQGPLPERKIHL